MSAAFEIRIDSTRLQRAMARAPGRLVAELNYAIGRAVLEMARLARRTAPKASSQLVNAIGGIQASPLEGLVIAGKDYARMVEDGTGGGGPMPPVENILDWVKVRRLVPNDPAMNQRDLAFAIARSIARKGTPAQPFMGPAFERHRGRTERLIDLAIDKALA